MRARFRPVFVDVFHCFGSTSPVLPLRCRRQNRLPEPPSQTPDAGLCVGLVGLLLGIRVGGVYVYAGEFRPVIVGLSRSMRSRQSMRHITSVLGGVLVLALGLGGCGGSDSPATPSPLPPQAVIPAPAPGHSWLPGHTLRGVSLSGVVYELTSTGRRPIPQAYVYCEACSTETHMFVLADDNGFYHFSGDLATGGGVWVAPGVPTDIAVGGSYNKDYEDPPGLPSSRRGPGWREVQIDGDTRFDIELVRRPATP